MIKLDHHARARGPAGTSSTYSLRASGGGPFSTHCFRRFSRSAFCCVVNACIISATNRECTPTNSCPVFSTISSASSFNASRLSAITRARSVGFRRFFFRPLLELLLLRYARMRCNMLSIKDGYLVKCGLSTPSKGFLLVVDAPVAVRH